MNHTIKSSDIIDLNQNDTKGKASSEEDFENRKMKGDDLMTPIESEQRSSSVTSVLGLENATSQNFELSQTNGSIETSTKVNIEEYSTNVSNSTAAKEQEREIPKIDKNGTRNGITKDNHMINGTTYKINEDNGQMEDDDNNVTLHMTYETSMHTTKETNEEEGSATGINDQSTKRSTTPFLNENSGIGE